MVMISAIPLTISISAISATETENCCLTKEGDDHGLFISCHNNNYTNPKMNHTSVIEK